MARLGHWLRGKYAPKNCQADHVKNQEAINAYVLAARLSAGSYLLGPSRPRQLTWASLR